MVLVCVLVLSLSVFLGIAAAEEELSPGQELSVVTEAHSQSVQGEIEVRSFDRRFAADGGGELLRSADDLEKQAAEIEEMMDEVERRYEEGEVGSGVYVARKTRLSYSLLRVERQADHVLHKASDGDVGNDAVSDALERVELVRGEATSTVERVRGPVSTSPPDFTPPSRQDASVEAGPPEEPSDERPVDTDGEAGPPDDGGRDGKEAGGGEGGDGGSVEAGDPAGSADDRGAGP